MIVSTPLDLPIIQPDDWEVFWKIWERESKTLVRKANNPRFPSRTYIDREIWRGMDFFSNRYSFSSWESPYYDISKELPIFYNNLINLPLPNISRIRIVQSTRDVVSHSDNNMFKWEVRGFLHFTSQTPQWYYTKPYDKENKYYMVLPKSTIWFSYNDKLCWHGTDYDPEHKKLLIQIFYTGNIDKLVEQSLEKYKDYTIDL